MSKLCNKQQNIAIVLGPKCVNATGLIRSLGEAGCYVVFASTSSNIESKYTKEYLRLPKGDEAQLETLYRYAQGLSSKPAVFTVDDHYNELLDENYARLEQVAWIPHAKGKLHEICDKAVMSQIAKDSGLRVPAFEKVDLHNAQCGLPLPVIIKPYAGYAGDKGDICLCYTKKGLSDCVETLKQKGYEEILIQELLQKEAQFEIGILGISLPSGEVEIPCTIKKIRSYPEGRGSTSYAQVKCDFFGVDKEKLKNFVRNTGYIGIFDIEMIVSGGEAYFIEINYRNGQYGYAPTKAGYNLPKNWLYGMLGKPIEKDMPIEEIFYINERDDKLHVRDGKVSRKQWKRQFREATAYGVYCKGDQRPYWRQYVKIPDRVKIKVGGIFHLIQDLLVKEEWNIAIRSRGDRLLFEDKNTGGFIVLKNSFRYWAADPFIITKDGRDYLFFEMYDRFRAKGLIGYRIIENGKIGKMQIAHEMSCHLSFPNVFDYKGETYIMPESCGAKKLVVLKAVDFPKQWQEAKTLMEKEVCDTVFLSVGEGTYLLTKPIGVEDSCLERYPILDGCIQEGASIVKGERSCRMAGAIIYRDGKIIRVAQDCLMGYGLALNFYEVTHCDKDSYSETELARIGIEDLPNKQRKKYAGIHTYNSNDNYEVIDFKNKNKFRLGNVINIFYRMIKKVLR